MSFAALLVASDAGSFAGLVSPPRFELKAKPGEVLKEVLEIGNDTSVADEFAVSTADWTLNAKGGVEFARPLDASEAAARGCASSGAPSRCSRGACASTASRCTCPRTLPRRSAASRSWSRRPPESMPEITAGNIQFPLSGRIGVIVYISVGDVAPKLELRDVGMKEFNGRITPAATFYNSGKRHGRPEGVLEGKDASGKSFEFVVSPFPILPGETRAVALWAQEGPDKKTPVIAYPLRLRGTIEWDGGKQSIDSTLNARAPLKAGSS